MAGVVIQKAVIEVEFDDLNKAQLALKKAGVEMVDFGKQADKAKGGTKGFGSSIGDLSEKLDKKLEQGLGRAFKATDRLQSIMGQAGTVAAVAGAAFVALQAIAKAMGDAFDQGAADIERAEKGLFDVAKAAEVAKAATTDMQKAIDEGSLLSVEKAIQLAKLRDQIATKSAQREIFLRLKVAAATEASFFSLTKTAAIQEAVGKSAEAQFVAGAEARSAQIAKLTDDIRKLGKSDLPFAGAITSLAFTLDDAISRLGDGSDELNTRAARGSKEAASAFLKSWQSAANEVRFQLGLVGAQFDTLAQHEFFQEETPFDRMKASALEAFRVVADVGGAAFEDFTHAVDESASATDAWGNAVTTVAVPAAVAITEGVTAAAFAAIAHGASFKDVLNDFLEAKSLEFTVSALGEVAKGIAASFLNPGLAGSHFAAAAAFGVAATAAGAGVALTGGFNGPTAASEGGGEREAFTGGADTGPDRSAAGGGVTETNINLNFAAGAGMSRIERAQTAQEVIGLMREAGASV